MRYFQAASCWSLIVLSTYFLAVFLRRTLTDFASPANNASQWQRSKFDALVRRLDRFTELSWKVSCYGAGVGIGLILGSARAGETNILAALTSSIATIMLIGVFTKAIAKHFGFRDEMEGRVKEQAFNAFCGALSLPAGYITSTIVMNWEKIQSEANKVIADPSKWADLITVIKDPVYFIIFITTYIFTVGRSLRSTRG